MASTASNRILLALALLVMLTSVQYSLEVQRKCQTQLLLMEAGKFEDAVVPQMEETTTPPQMQTIATQPQMIMKETVPIDWEKQNSERIKIWRQKLKIAIRRNDTELIQNLTAAPFTFHTIQACENVFIDFGSNVGDSLRKFIDTGFPEFVNRKQPLLDLETGAVGKTCYDCKRRTKHRWILGRHVTPRLRRGTGPEDYCFYGIEGNPAFTERLLHTQERVLHMDPRPVKHVHFFTRHIGAGTDGPTQLYLDTINSKDNYWGSSVFASHIDVAASNGTTAINVTGITLTRLLNETVLPSGWVVIKIDIEGGEYALLEEAINSNIFCDMHDKGATIHMILEPHNSKITGTTEPDQHFKTINATKRIRDCGVFLRLADAGR